MGGNDIIIHYYSHLPNLASNSLFVKLTHVFSKRATLLLENEACKELQNLQGTLQHFGGTIFDFLNIVYIIQLVQLVVGGDNGDSRFLLSIFKLVVFPISAIDTFLH
ncbi:hypothetical protein ACJX0J_009299 [Zea mays]